VLNRTPGGLTPRWRLRLMIQGRDGSVNGSPESEEVARLDVNKRTGAPLIQGITACYRTTYTKEAASNCAAPNPK